LLAVVMRLPIVFRVHVRGKGESRLSQSVREQSFGLQHKDEPWRLKHFLGSIRNDCCREHRTNTLSGK